MMSENTCCDPELLDQMLGDSLTEPQEEALAAHLARCADCRRLLEQRAGDQRDWTRISAALRKEAESNNPESSCLFPAGATIDWSTTSRRQLHLIDIYVENTADFAVDFLEPTENADAVGRLGDIEILEIIGRGAMGIVLKGFQRELNRPVAVKVLAPHLATSGAARQRFAREARATAVIVHPHVMPILTVDSNARLPYLVMPYLACESLQQRIDREGPLDAVDVLRIGTQVARGLAAAHAHGLVHRDVKPANILIEQGVDRVMLTDFGLARAVDDATLTRTGVIAGTPQYMSPEQASGDAIDETSDLFSLGSVLYAMITGRPPFRAETSYGILHRIISTHPRPIHELADETPVWLIAIVDKLLEKSAADRFASAEELAQLLEQCLLHAQQPATVPLPARARQLEDRTRSRKTSRQSHLPRSGRLKAGWARWVGLGALAVLSLGIFSDNARSVVSRLLYPSPEQSSSEHTETPPGTSPAALTDVKDPELPLTAAEWIPAAEQRLDELGNDINRLEDSVQHLWENLD